MNGLEEFITASSAGIVLGMVFVAMFDWVCGGSHKPSRFWGNVRTFPLWLLVRYETWRYYRNNPVDFDDWQDDAWEDDDAEAEV